MKETTIVRENLMTEPGYTGYCGNVVARHRIGGCSNPRTVWSRSLEQFVCPECGWTSQYPADFIERYKQRWNLTKGDF